MKLIEPIVANTPEIAALRKDIHAHPELCFQEVRTADVVAAKLATVLQAEKLMMLTNISGVLDKQGALMTDLTAQRIDELFADCTISGGILPKIAGALDAAKSGVNSVHIIDGRVPHVLLLEILTDQAFGTMIRSH